MGILRTNCIFAQRYIIKEEMEAKGEMSERQAQGLECSVSYFDFPFSSADFRIG